MFAVVGYSKTDREISEWTLADAIRQIECDYGTPRESLSEEFWQFEGWDKTKGPPQGVYEALKMFAPKGLAVSGGIPDSVQAVNAIMRFKPMLARQMAEFAAMVAEDIQNYGTIPARTVRAMAQCDRLTDECIAVERMQSIIEELLDLRGPDYLEGVKIRAAKETILITVEKR